jgi:uncharacterized tellurite resistance protein B-like protein
LGVRIVLNALKSFFASHADQPAAASAEAPDQRLRVAACALLLEIAHADDEFTADERRHIEEALVRHFDLPLETARELMALAEEQRRISTDLYQFTSLINANYDEGQRMVLTEVLWRVVYADGKLSQHEEYLMRKLANLLELRPGYLAEARNRAQHRRHR